MNHILNKINSYRMKRIIELKDYNRSLGKQIKHLSYLHDYAEDDLFETLDETDDQNQIRYYENICNKYMRSITSLTILQDYNGKEITKIRKEIKKSLHKGNKLNILFLDLDGVINNSDLTQEHDHEIIPEDWNQYHPELVKNIKEIIHRYNFKLVISSTWRKDYTIPHLDCILNNLWYLDCEILDYTTKQYLDTDYRERYEWDPNTESRDRGLQITDWLNSRKYDVENYVVIDDDLDAKYGHENNYFEVDSRVGFDKNHLAKFHKFMETLNVKSK